MGKIESFKGQEKLVSKIKKKIKKEQISIIFTNDTKIKNEIDKIENLLFIEEIKMNLKKESYIDAVNENRKENLNKKRIKRKHVKNYETLSFLKEGNMSLVTSVEQLSDSILIDEIKTFLLENLEQKINIFLQEKELEEICIEDLYNYILQQKINAKIYVSK